MITFLITLAIQIKNETRTTSHFQGSLRIFRAGDERIELPLRVLETPVMPFDQSPLLITDLSAYLQNCIYDVLLPSGQTLTRLVAVSSTCCHAPTSALSTSSSPRGFPCLAASGYLISGEASRLDAFSAYPLPARLPGGAPGGAAGTPAASPPRSSRTRGGSLQISCARTG